MKGALFMSEWNVIDPKPAVQPLVTIRRGSFTFHPTVCSLFPDIESYHFVQFLSKRALWDTVYAVRFLKEYDENCFPLRKQTYGEETCWEVDDAGMVSNHFFRDLLPQQASVDYAIEKNEKDDDGILRIIG